MDLGLEGKAALVTAASEGLGLACAVRLAEAGCGVAIAARGEEKLAAARDAIAAKGGGAAHALKADLTSGPGLAGLVDEAAALLGGLDILVVNSGHVAYGGLEDLDEAAWSEAYELVLMSAARLARRALPHLRRRGGGDIVFLSSATVKEPSARLLLSNVMRAGVSGLAKTLAHAVAGENIRVNVVAPGYFDTGRIRRRVDALVAGEGVARAEAARQVAGVTPMGRLGVASELAELVVFVVSRRAAYLTGSTIVIDGGASRGLF